MTDEAPGIAVHAVEEAEPSRPRRSLWRHAEFRLLWAATTVSQLGSQVSELALPLIAIVTLHATPLAVGFLAAVQFIPFIVLGLPAGVWVDRVARRPILIVGDLARAVILLSIPLAYGIGILTIWQLYGVGFVTGSLTVLFDVAYSSYVPSLVEREQLIDANGKLQVSEQGAGVVGPGMAGVLIGRMGAPVAIVVDALSFVASALLVLRIRRPEIVPDRQTRRGNPFARMGAESGEGLRFVIRHPFLRPVLLSSATANLFGRMVQVVLLIYLARGLGLTPARIGIVFSIGSLGFVVGALCADRVSARLGVGRAMIVGSLIAAPSLLLIALAPRVLAPASVAAGSLLYGVGALIFSVNHGSLRQAVAPPRLRGRVNATWRLLVWGTLPIAYTVGGFLGSVIGLRQTIVIGAIGLLIAPVPLLLSPVRALVRLPEPDAESENRLVQA